MAKINPAIEPSASSGICPTKLIFTSSEVLVCQPILGGENTRGRVGEYTRPAATYFLEWT